MVFPAERMRNASTRSCSLSTSGTGSATVRHAGIPTVRYTAREKIYAAVVQEKNPYLVSFRDSGTNEHRKWARGVGIYTLVYAENGVAPMVREGEQNRRLHKYERGRCWYCEKVLQRNAPREEPSKNMALSSHVCSLPKRPTSPSNITACSRACTVVCGGLGGRDGKFHGTVNSN